LQNQKFTDYSLLVGISPVLDGQRKSLSTDTGSTNYRRNAITMDLRKELKGTPLFGSFGGITNHDGKKIYYMGIIDILTRK